MRRSEVQRAALAAAGILAFTGPGPASAARLPDLRATALTVVDPGAATGGALRVRATVKGTVRRARTVFLLSRDATRGRGDRALVATPSGRVTRLTIPATTAPGAWRVIVCADGTGRVRERSERNNCRSIRRPVWLVRGYRAPRQVDLDVALDAPRAATATLGRGGGTLSATAADGTTFTLTIPDGGLAVPDTTITMTPIATVGRSPLAGKLLGGVRLEPHGLKLYGPATLDIRPPAAPATRELLVALGAFDAGKDAHLEPSIGAPGGGLRIGLSHFSDHVGMSASAAAIDAASARTPTSREAWAKQNLVRATTEERARQLAGEDVRDLEANAAYVAQYVSLVERIGPLVAAAETNPALAEVAIREFLSWERQNQLRAVKGFSKEVLAQLDRYRAALERIVRRLADAALKQCFVDKVPGGVAALLDAERMLQLLGFSDGSIRLLGDAQACDHWDLRFSSSMVLSSAVDGASGTHEYDMRGSVELPSRLITRAPWTGSLETVRAEGTIIAPDRCSYDNESYTGTDEFTIVGNGAPGVMSVELFGLRHGGDPAEPPRISLELRPGSPTHAQRTRSNLGTPCPQSTTTEVLPMWALWYIFPRSLDGTIADSSTASPLYRFFTGWQRGTGPVFATRTAVTDTVGTKETTVIDVLYTPLPRPPEPEPEPPR